MTARIESIELPAAAAARSLTDRIKLAVEATWQLIGEAYASRAWAALGYSTWDDYCLREFGTSRLRIPREDRQEIVASLRDSGLSIRAIASATSEPRSTVADELSRVRDRTPDRPGVTGTDGKTYPAPLPREQDSAQPWASARAPSFGSGGHGAFVRPVTPLVPVRNAPKMAPSKSKSSTRPEPYRAPELGRTMSQLLARGNEVVVHAATITERMLAGQSQAAAVWLERVNEIVEPLQDLTRLLERAAEVQA